MRAIAVQHFGDEPEVVDLPIPEPGPGQVQVRLVVAAINPMDMAAAAGRFARMGAHRFPLVLGFDGAGTVSAVGPDVQELAVGDPVFGQFWTDPLGYGTYAEYTIMAERGPSGGRPGRSRRSPPACPWRRPPRCRRPPRPLGALDNVGCGAGETLLLIGATGGLGTFATQIVASRGIHVVATAAADAADGIRRLGAARTIDYKATPLGEALSVAVPDGLDGVVDATGDRDSVSGAARHLKDRRSVVSVAFGASDDLLNDRRIRAINYQLDDKPARLREVGRLAAAQVITPVISDEIAFDDALATLRRPRGGARGKVIIRIQAR